MDSFYTKGGLLSFLKKHKLIFSKSMGQNFLHNRNIMRAIIKALQWEEGATVLEIGPGLGHLTWVMLDEGYRVIALEKDRTFISAIKELSQYVDPDAQRHEVLEMDATGADYTSLQQQYGVQHVIGNLPYYATVPILFKIAYDQATFSSLGFMMQKEVGERILAEPCTKEYGRLSVVLNYLFSIKRVKYVPPKSFIPQPNVESVFMKFTPKPEADNTFAQDYLERAVQFGFMHRRKKLRGQFKGRQIKQITLKDNVLEQLENEFNLDERAQDWPMQTWVKFARRLHDLQPTASNG